MPISNRELSEGEEVLVDAHPHPVVLAAPATVTAVAVAVAVVVAAQFPNAPTAVAGVLAALVLVPAAWLVERAVVRHSVSLVVTTHRLLLQRGVLRRDVTQLRLSRVADVHCTQTLVERLIGAGRLVLELGGDEGTFIVDDMRRPRALQRVIGARIGVPDDLDDPRRFDDDHGPGSAFDRAPATPPHGLAPVPGIDTPTAPAPDHSVVSVHRQLIELDDLRRRGILTQAEFERKKADLLSRL